MGRASTTKSEAPEGRQTCNLECLSPLRGSDLFIIHNPTACAVGYILTPLRGFSVTLLDRSVPPVVAGGSRCRHHPPETFGGTDLVLLLLGRGRRVVLCGFHGEVA